MKSMRKAMPVPWLLFAAMLVGARLAAASAAAAPPAVAVSRIVPAQPSLAAPNQIGVLVFFNFTPASRAFLARLKQWAAGAGSRIVLDREPLVKGNDVPLARAFIVARTLGITDSVLPSLFRAAAEMPRKQQAPAPSTAVIAGAFKPAGIGGVEFTAAWNSPAADNGLIRARALAARYEVSGAPVVIVNGLWRLVPAAGTDAASLIAALDRQISVVGNTEAVNQ